jgi:tRNA-dihydrouridine synthase B
MSFSAIKALMFDWKSASRPILGVSPMADMTDTPFNLVCKAHGAPLIFKEMVSSEAVIRGSEKTIRMAMNDDGERPLIQQIFGSDPGTMAKAAEIIYERCKPDAFDINMGCPVYKIVSNFDGSALMKEPKKAAEIVRAMKNAVPVPVSVKTRLGWEDDRECLEFSKVLEDAGADALTIHGRTKAQLYMGIANWERIGEVKKLISIPLLLNGDVKTGSDALRALEISKADGILIGRGVLGNPWIFEEIKAALVGKQYTAPTLEERIETVRKHSELQIAHYGEKGLILLRKHLPYYFKGDHGTKELRSALVRITTKRDLENALGLIH